MKKDIINNSISYSIIFLQNAAGDQGSMQGKITAGTYLIIHYAELSFEFNKKFTINEIIYRITIAQRLFFLNIFFNLI